LAVTLFLSGFAGGPAAFADSDYFQPGNLLLSRVVYDNNPNNVQAGVTLPAAEMHGCDSVRDGDV
jgi:hypothetical protein